LDPIHERVVARLVAFDLLYRHWGTDAQPAMSAAPHKARISFILNPPFGRLTIGGNIALSKTARQ